MEIKQEAVHEIFTAYKNITMATACNICIKYDIYDTHKEINQQTKETKSIENYSFPTVIKKFLALYKTHRFVTMFTRAFYSSLFWAKLM